MSNKVYLCRIYKKLSKPNNKKRNNLNNECDEIILHADCGNGYMNSYMC